MNYFRNNRTISKVASKCLLLALALSLFWLAAGCQTAESPSASDREPATYELEVDLLDTRNTFSLDSQGRVNTSVQMTSADGTISLSIDKDTILLDKDGKPLQFIHIAIDPTLPLSPEGAYIVGAVYDLRPQEATFNPQLKLTLSYDPDELPEGAKENAVCIASYEDTKWNTVRYQQVDTERHRVTAEIRQFARIAVLAPEETPLEPPPKPSPEPDLASIPLEQALSSGKPTLAEFGSNTCIPCKQMKPILEELAVGYIDKLNIVIVEVYEHMDLARQYQIMAIPTQIFFDSSGKEVTRHMGFWPREEIIAQLKKMEID